VNSGLKVFIMNRQTIFLFNEVRVYHRPHPSPDTDKGAVANIASVAMAEGKSLNQWIVDTLEHAAPGFNRSGGFRKKAY
ncbi:MAG: hypothetical protein KKD21_05750, partial [Proteobacteria bacterium]|nr:hypothetical protein [Pseudomonadota bacterium]